MQLSAFPFSTILFDLDGTLVDSAPDVLEAIAAVLRDAGDPVPRMELSIIGPPLEGIFREVCPDADEAKIARHVAAFRDLYFGGTFPQSTPYPGIFALLERLRAKGCRLFVATHKPEAAAQRMLTLKGFKASAARIPCRTGNSAKRISSVSLWSAMPSIPLQWSWWETRPSISEAATNRA